MSKTASGPPGHLLLGHLPALRRDPLGFLTHCARNYGPVVPLRLPLIPTFLLLDPADIERVLVTDHKDFIKPLWLRTQAVRRLLGDGLVTSDGQSWRRQRRICQPAFHPGLMDGYGQTMAALTERMLTGWEAGQERDVQHDLARLTLEIVTQTLLGTDSAAQSGEISAVMDTLMRCFSAGHSLFGILPLPPTPRESIAVRQLNGLVDGLIAAGEENAEAAPDQPPTLLALLSDTASPHQIREQVKTFLAAGHESSALALTWTFLLLARHPKADAQLDAELQEVLGVRPPTPADLPHLPYTQAVVREALRLYPPLWMTGRKAVRRCEIGGYDIPAGSLILTSPWAMQRHPHYFSAPDEFRPERWEDPEMTALPRFAHFPFGGGPRVCIGQGFALVETTLLLAVIARRFRLELMPGPAIRPWPTMTLRPPAGILMRLTAREPVLAQV